MTAHGGLYPKPPAHLAVFCDALGTERAIAFLLRFGGSEVHLSEHPTQRSAIAQAFGLDAARALARVRDRVPPSIPLGKPWLAACMRAKGQPVAEIARRLHASAPTVRRWLRTEARRVGDAP